MHLIQVFLPLYDNHGHKLPDELYNGVRTELIERFGGMTAYNRAPAEGLWKEQGEKTTHDEIVIFEVMDDALDRSWWRTYRKSLEACFHQEQLIVRAQETELL